MHLTSWLFWDLFLCQSQYAGRYTEFRCKRIVVEVFSVKISLSEACYIEQRNSFSIILNSFVVWPALHNIPTCCVRNSLASIYRKSLLFCHRIPTLINFFIYRIWGGRMERMVTMQCHLWTRESKEDSFMWLRLHCYRITDMWFRALSRWDCQYCHLYSGLRNPTVHFTTHYWSWSWS